jgi:hypothetical protein
MLHGKDAVPNPGFRVRGNQFLGVKPLSGGLPSSLTRQLTSEAERSFYVEKNF